MKLKGNRIKTSSGRVLKFQSAKKRENWESFARAVKHGWKPDKRKT